MESRLYHPIKLSSRHRQGIQFLVSGLPLHQAAKLASISESRLSVVRHSPLGEAYANELHTKADTLVIRMLALGMTPEELLSMT